MLLLFLYLRRALAGLRAGVGGPLMSQDMPSVSNTAKKWSALKTLCAFRDFNPRPRPRNYIAPSHEAIIVVKENLDRIYARGPWRHFLHILSHRVASFFSKFAGEAIQFIGHLAILSARSSKHYGPLVLGFAGGKA